ncbi:MAG: hypothetical protein ABIJ21_04145 [Nanoarchaeota archaeon]
MKKLFAAGVLSLGVLVGCSSVLMKDDSGWKAEKIRAEINSEQDVIAGLIAKAGSDSVGVRLFLDQWVDEVRQIPAEDDTTRAIYEIFNAYFQPRVSHLYVIPQTAIRYLVVPDSVFLNDWLDDFAGSSMYEAFRVDLREISSFRPAFTGGKIPLYLTDKHKACLDVFLERFGAASSGHEDIGANPESEKKFSMLESQIPLRMHFGCNSSEGLLEYVTQPEILKVYLPPALNRAIVHYQNGNSGSAFRMEKKDGVWVKGEKYKWFWERRSF